VNIISKKIKIPTTDGYLIYGDTSQNQENKDDLIILVHGLGDNKDNEFFQNATNFFCVKNYNIFKFNLYGRNKFSRKITQTPLSTQIKDLGVIIKHFKNDYKNIHLIGHSLGGYLVLATKEDKYIKNKILWDPSMEPSQILFPKNYNQKVKKDLLKVPTIKDLLANSNKSLNLIFAEKGAFRITPQTYIKYLPKKKKIYLIKKADHIFSKKKDQLELFSTTLKLLK